MFPNGRRLSWSFTVDEVSQSCLEIRGLTLDYRLVDGQGIG